MRFSISDDGLVPQLIERALSTSVNTKTLLTHSQSHAIQVVSCVLSGISLLAALITFVWFARMKRKFRHRYVMA